MLLVLMFCFVCCRENIIGTDNDPNELLTCEIINYILGFLGIGALRAGVKKLEVK